MVETINILFIGDVVGESGIKIVEERAAELKAKYEIDFAIVNGENADKGKGITKKESNRLFDAGFDVITSGNHIFENWNAKPLLKENPKVLRPFNYPPGNIGLGYYLGEIIEGINICVLNIQGRTFMQSIDCPFRAADFVLKSIDGKAKIILVDFHADATAEKICMGWHLDGRVSAVVGTHTHVPTSDAQILPKRTAYISDVGMTGPYDSVVGMSKKQALRRYLLQTPHKYKVAEREPRICGVAIEIDAETGNAISIEQIIYPEFKTKK